LKGSWSYNKVSNTHRDITKLESIFSDSNKSDFEVIIYKDQLHEKFHEDFREKLDFLLKERAVFRIEKGFFDSDKMEFEFKLNGTDKNIALRSSLVPTTKKIVEEYGMGWKELDKRKLECGNFGFEFYIFDFTSKAPAKYKLDREDIKILKEHRIYLYRDNIRVYPYGEPNDDWLQIDTYRGTISAGHFLSNDQVVGVVNISQKNNLNLVDKTDREGLIDEGNATQDFIRVLQAFLAYIRQKPYARYRKDLESKKEQDIFKEEVVSSNFENLKSAIKDNKKALDILVKAERAY
jgi:hypothetical protein